MLTTVVAIAILSIGSAGAGSEYVSIQATNRTHPFRSVLQLPAKIPKSEALASNRLNYAYIAVENVCDKPLPIWDALWPGSTMFYIKGDKRIFPAAQVLMVMPPLPIHLKVMLKPGHILLQHIRLSQFWEIDKMLDGSSQVTISFDDEYYWPEAEKSSAVGPFFFTFVVTVKGDLIFFEPVTKSN